MYKKKFVCKKKKLPKRESSWVNTSKKTELLSIKCRQGWMFRHLCTLGVNDY